jgi:hypothetical protein
MRTRRCTVAARRPRMGVGQCGAPQVGAPERAVRQKAEEVSFTSPFSHAAPSSRLTVLASGPRFRLRVGEPVRQEDRLLPSTERVRRPARLSRLLGADARLEHLGRHGEHVAREVFPRVHRPGHRRSSCARAARSLPASSRRPFAASAIPRPRSRKAVRTGYLGSGRGSAVAHDHARTGFRLARRNAVYPCHSATKARARAFSPASSAGWRCSSALAGA